MAVSVIVQVIPSAITVSSALIDRSIAGTTTTLTKSKEIVVTFPGIYLIKFSYRSTASTTVQCQIFRNGTAVGVFQETTSLTYIEATETIGGWNRGDLCQLYAMTKTGTGGGGLSSFRLLGSYSNSGIPIPAGRVTVDAAV